MFNYVPFLAPLQLSSSTGKTTFEFLLREWKISCAKAWHGWRGPPSLQRGN